MKYIRLVTILFAFSFFLLFDDVHAAVCNYNVGGIACCKRLGDVKLVEGTTVDKVCTGGFVSNSLCGSDWSDCHQVNVEVERDASGNPSEKSCKAMSGKVTNQGTTKYENCNIKIVDRKTRFCVCDVYQKKVDRCCKKYSCPSGTKEIDGECVATSTKTVTGCVEYEKQEDERVCPAYITWESQTSAQCYSKLTSYSDSYDWNSCVYTDNTMKEDNYGDSVYCPVYCLENFSAYVSNDTPNVKAGMHFTFPNSNNSLTGQRWCKTKSIDYDKFLSDLNYANKKVEEFYRLWKIEEAKDDALSKFEPASKKNCAYFCDYNVGGIECCTGGSIEKQECEDTEGLCDVFTCDSYTDKTHHGYRWSYQGGGSAYSGKVTIDGVGTRFGVNTWCDYNEDAPTYNPDYYKQQYEKWLSTIRSIYQRMKNCYDWGDFSDEQTQKEFYNVDPSVSLTYQGANGNKYSYDGLLNVDTEIDVINDVEECDPSTVKVIIGYDNNNNKIVENWPIKKCTKREVQANSYSSLELKNDVYRYVNKANGVSFHAGQLNQFINNKYFNYIDIGYGNLPVSFATKPGLYGYSTQLGELSITYRNIGHIDENGKSRIEKVIDVEANKNGKSDYYKVYCDYEVTNGIVPDIPKPNNPIPGNPDEANGVTLIYRPIDLYNPFPSIDGNGRNTGANWCDSKSCSNTNDVVDKYILNNREVAGNDVYDLEPMYSFTLTPTIINQIREYNRDHTYDYDNDGIKTGMVCDKGTGEHCISDYLTELIKMTNSTGTCTGDRKSNFDTCRYN